MRKHMHSCLFTFLVISVLTFNVIVYTEGSPTVTPSLTTPIIPTEHISKKSTANQSGDVYLDAVNKDCLTTKDTVSCVKYKALKYLHSFASPLEGERWRREFTLIGPLKLLALPQEGFATVSDHLFEQSEPKSTDNEVMKLIRFTLREMERFVRSYGFAFSVPNSSSSDDASTPRFIDDDFFSGTFKEVAARGKKKTLMFLLPLISFFHLKALLVPILLSVLFIKKIMMLGVLFLPSLLSLVKFCKPTHHHMPWYPEPETAYDYHEYTPHYDNYKSFSADHENDDIAPDITSWNTAHEIPQSWSGYEYGHGQNIDPDKSLWNTVHDAPQYWSDYGKDSTPDKTSWNTAHDTTQPWTHEQKDSFIATPDDIANKQVEKIKWWNRVNPLLQRNSKYNWNLRRQASRKQYHSILDKAKQIWNMRRRTVRRPERSSVYRPHEDWDNGINTVNQNLNQALNSKTAWEAHQYEIGNGEVQSMRSYRNQSPLSSEEDGNSEMYTGNMNRNDSRNSKMYHLSSALNQKTNKLISTISPGNFKSNASSHL